MYFRSIQFLRFIAALYITLFHISYWWNYKHDALGGLFDNGYGAIDLFFVISGFVVVQSAATFKTGWASFLLFLKKRFVRIYPVYWLFLLFFLITGMVNISGRTGFQIWQAIFLLPGHQGIIRTTWTLQYELYFYFLIGLTVLNRNGKYLIGALFLFSLAANSASLLAAIVYNWHIPVFGFYNEFVLEFFLGTVIWKLFNKVPFWLAILLMLTGAVLFLVPIKINASHIVAFGIPAALLLTGLTALEWQQKIKIPGFMVLLGNASYSLYLIHPPLIHTILGKLDAAYATNRWLILLFVMALSALAVLVYLKIERPLLRILNSYLQKETDKAKTKKLLPE
jgi:peptidoglycan/LPS O-acetylase OafA/YrhL